MLGQLLLMQNVLCNLPDEKSIFGFVCRGLADLPGIAVARHGEPAECDAGDVLHRLPLQVGSSDWGNLWVGVSDPEAFAPYEAYLKNFVFMVAVILEERRQRRLNEQHQAQLEQRVQDRTRQLTTEIAERRCVEDLLQRTRNMLAHTLDSIPQAVFWKDRLSVYLGCNRVFAQAVGLGDPELVVGKTDFDLPWPRGEAEAYRQDDQVVIAQGCAKHHIVEPLQRADGVRLWIDTTKVPLVDEAGQVYGVLGVFEDITERRQAEEEKARWQEQLIQAQKMESVGRLAGGVAHDFNNMLQAIFGYAGLALEQAGDSAELKEDLEEILKAARRSTDLTQQLLAFARKQTVLPRLLDLNETVASMLKMLQRLIGENIQLVWSPHPALWPVLIDPVQIDQMLANLTVNARDAIGGAGRIIIETANRSAADGAFPLPADAEPGDYVMLSVCDTGSGIDAATREHLFEPFFTTKALGHGTGLGLATVYGIVKQNRGQIVVQSEPGRGTTFTIFLPRSLGAAGAPTEKRETATRGGTETVLLVEDEAQILNLGKRILEERGYSVLAASLPEEALALVARFPGPIHLMITDVVMPGLNGRELQARVAALKPGLRCLYISGYTAEVIAHQGVMEEGMALLPKPFSVAGFAQKVREVLDRAPGEVPV